MLSCTELLDGAIVTAVLLPTAQHHQLSVTASIALQHLDAKVLLAETLQTGYKNAGPAPKTISSFPV